MKPSRHLPLPFCLLLILGLQSSVLSRATAAPRDLGQNLTYLRLHRLPEDGAMLAAAWGQPALIVDLRYSAGTATLLPADLASRPRSAPLFALISPATPPEALAALRDRAPALITLGSAAPGSAPDIALAVTPDADRRAYEALDSGASVDSLIGEKIAKTRFDEAALAQVHAKGTAREEGPAATEEAPASPPPPAPPAELKDVVLQRAVQLHRALGALGKLPRS